MSWAGGPALTRALRQEGDFPRSSVCTLELGSLPGARVGILPEWPPPFASLAPSFSLTPHPHAQHCQGL